MLLAYPHPRILVLQVPVRPAKRGPIFCHARLAAFERVVGSESTGENAKPKFEMRDAISGHASNGVIQLFGRDEGHVVREECVIFCDRLNVAKASFCTTHEMREAARQIVL